MFKKIKENLNLFYTIMSAVVLIITGVIAVETRYALADDLQAAKIEAQVEIDEAKQQAQRELKESMYQVTTEMIENRYKITNFELERLHEIPEEERSIRVQREIDFLERKSQNLEKQLGY